ncbi:MAG: hypothetical protein V3T72_01115, partial [Thermoanaerobaculia bacterium]
MIHSERPRPSAVGIEPTLGKLDDLAQHLGVILELGESEIVVSDSEGIEAKLSWSSRRRRLEALFPFRADETSKAERIRASLRELSIEPLERQGKPNFLKLLTCELEPDRATAVVRHVLSRAL